MSENTFEKKQPQEEETELEKEIKGIKEKYANLMKEEIRKDQAELIEAAFEAYGDNPEKLKNAMYLMANKWADDHVKDIIGVFEQTKNYWKNKSSNPKDFFNEEDISKTIH